MAAYYPGLGSSVSFPGRKRRMDRCGCCRSPASGKQSAAGAVPVFFHGGAADTGPPERMAPQAAEWAAPGKQASGCGIDLVWKKLVRRGLDRAPVNGRRPCRFSLQLKFPVYRVSVSGLYIFSVDIPSFPVRCYHKKLLLEQAAGGCSDALAAFVGIWTCDQ